MRAKIQAIKRLVAPASLLLLLSICYSKPAAAQGQLTNMGTDFLLAFHQNYTYTASSGGLYLELKIVAPKATHVKITYLLDNTVEEFNIAANSVHSYVLTAAQKVKIYPNNTATAQKTVMRIETDNGVTVYAINMYANTTDGTAVLPVSNCGSSYLNVGVPESTCVVIATEDDTRVSVNGAYVATLSKHQARVFGAVGQKISAEHTDGTPVDIVVFNAYQCSNWPDGACDTQWEQLVPIANFGREFFVPKTLMDLERVSIVAEQTTTVTYQIGTGSTQTATVSPGAATTLTFTADMRLSADKPVAITTHIGLKQTIPAAENEDGVQVTGGDPSTAWVPPIEQNINSAYITPFKGGTSVIKAHYALVVAKTENKTFTTVNGAAPVPALNTAGWRDHPSGYSSIIIHLPQLIPYTVLNPKGMILLAYGVGGSESYYYLAAASSRKLDAAFYITNGGDRYHYQDANLSVPFDCGSPFYFEAEVQYELHSAAGHLRWYIDGAEVPSARDQLTWTQPYLSGGDHVVRLVVKDIDGAEKILETTLKVECGTELQGDATLNEGDTKVMKITLSGIAPTNIAFALSAHTGTTASSDYSFPATVTIPAGASEVTFNVNALADNVINELNEILVLRAYNSEYGDLTAAITILDVATTAQKTLSISVNPAEIYEPHTGFTSSPTQTTVTVSLPTGVATVQPIAVPLSFTTSTATVGSDYTLNSGNTAFSNVTIPTGGTTGAISFTVEALEDNLYEGDEYVYAVATAPAGGYTVSGSATGSASVKIIDRTPGDIMVAMINDAEEVLSPASGKFKIHFSKTAVTTKKAIEIVYTLTSTANDGTVYQLIDPTKATIPVDASSIEVEIVPINDYIVEGSKEVKIELISVTVL